MLSKAGLAAFLAVVFASFSPSAAQDGLECYVSVVMDTYCVDLGVLLDNPSVETLRNPELHSVHCLVDVPRCIDGGYELLAPTPAGSEYPWGRYLRLDQNGNDMVVELARSLGSCSTCSGTGSLARDFRAAVVGNILPDSGTPPVFAVQSVLPYEQGCPEGTTVLEPNSDELSFDAGGAQKKVLTHASLMLIGWGFLLPLGIISARFLRHRPNALWFKMHRALQIIGLIIAIIGWAIALKNFTVLESGGSGTSALEKKAWAHAVCGTTAMALGLLQPLNALLRPHAPQQGEKKPKSRFAWELLHKSFGYIGAILALVTIGLGTRIISSFENQFLAGFIACLVVLAVAAFIMIVDGIRYKKKNVEMPAEGPKEEQTTPYGSSEQMLQ